MLFNHHDYYFFNFFRNREVGALYITLSLVSFAISLLSVFVPVYFWQIGFPIWKILFFYALVSAYFLFFTIILIPYLRRASDKILIFLSAPLLILYYLGLSEIGALPVLYFVLPGVVALNMLFFNLGYHIGFTAAVDDDSIGREVGVRYLLEQLTHFSAPFVGGFLITAYGFYNTFFVGSVILLLAVVPLFFIPKRNLSGHLSLAGMFGYLASKELVPFSLLGAGFAVEKVLWLVVWSVFLFLAVGTTETLGIIVSTGLLLGAVVTYLAGLMADRGRRRLVLTVSTALLSATWFVSPFLALRAALSGVHIFGQVARSALLVSWTSQYYKLARKVQHTTLFILSREFLYHLSRLAVTLTLVVVALLVPLRAFFILSFFIAGLFTLLHLYGNSEKHASEIEI